MSAILHRLRGLAFFRELDPETVEAIAQRSEWFSLPGGWSLFGQGSPSRAMHFVLSGRLIVVRACAGGQSEDVVGYVRAGEPVGEMSLLSGEDHSASVYALRDAEILSLPRAEVAALLERHADFASALARSVLSRARHPRESFRRASPRVFAFVATSPSIDVEAKARLVADAIARCGLSVCVLDETDADHAFVSFEAREAAHDIVLVAARMADSPWYRFVLRHADRFLVFARRDARAPSGFALSIDDMSAAAKFRLVDLVMVHEGAPSGNVREWAVAAGASRVLQWRGPGAAAQIGRIISGKSVGLVLSGGGARAYAHVGVLRALHERGVPVDFVCGASMGAIVAACHAMGWSLAEIDRRIRDAFVSSNPLGDHVMPVVALTRGARVEERLKRHFGDVLIEDLMAPFFCVSSELTQGRTFVHRFGRLRDALRATISLPGILPPVVTGERLLVDGAVMNNFPTELMAGFHRGVTIGVDVAQEGTINTADFVDPPGFIDWALRRGLKAPPPIVSLLMRAATSREEGDKRRQPADVMIAPMVPGVELRDWKKFDVAVEDGYQATLAAIDAKWSDLGPIAAAAAAD